MPNILIGCEIYYDSLIGNNYKLHLGIIMENLCRSYCFTNRFIYLYLTFMLRYLTFF